MRRELCITILFLTGILAGCGGKSTLSSGMDMPAPYTEQQVGETGLVLTAAVGTRTVTPAEKFLPVTINLTNEGSQVQRIQFNSGQRVDVSVRDEGGNELWRWSDGRMFTMAIGVEELAPGESRGETLQVPFPPAGTLTEPGPYQVFALLTGEPAAEAGPMVVRYTGER